MTGTLSPTGTGTELRAWALRAVAALLVVAVQASLVSEVTLHAGLYLFTAAVVLSIAATQRLRALARRARKATAA